MSKTTKATNWEIMCKDDSGAIVNLDYVCPHCDYSTGEIIKVGASSVKSLDGPWETDQICVICGKDVTIACY